MREGMSVKEIGWKKVIKEERNEIKWERLEIRDELIRRIGNGKRMIVGEGKIGIDGVIGGIDRGKIGVSKIGRGNGIGFKIVERLGNGKWGKLNNSKII